MSLNVIAERYLAAVQALALHDPSLVDHWIGPEPSPAGSRRPVAEVMTEITELKSRLGTVEPPQDENEKARYSHLDAQLEALTIAARRLTGESLRFDDEARLAFGLGQLTPDPRRFEATRRRLDAELAGLGSLNERVRAFRQRFAVPEDRQDAVIRLALARCRDAIQPSVSLPQDEGLEVRFVPALGWDSHARYLGGHRTLIEVNADRPLDLTRALRLACHEGYPGHHVQYIWSDAALVGERRWAEFRLVPGFGRQLFVAEGAAEAGADLAMPAERRLREYRDYLGPAAGLAAGDLDRLVRVEDLLADLEPIIADIARAYLDNQINADRARDRLRDEALVADPDAMLPFIERQRTRLLAYPAGRRVIRQAVGREGLAALRVGFVDRVMFSFAFATAPPKGARPAD